jgi:hypothetical protein
MIRLALTRIDGKWFDLYVEAFDVCESVDGACRVVSIPGTDAQYFVKESREQIAAQVQP